MAEEEAVEVEVVVKARMPVSTIKPSHPPTHQHTNIILRHIYTPNHTNTNPRTHTQMSTYIRTPLQWLAHTHTHTTYQSKST